MSRVGQLTAATAARRVQEELNRGDSDFALRLISSTLEALRDASARDDLRHFLAVAPRRINDRRWDALLRSAIAWQLAELGAPTPAWTAVERLPEPLYLWPDEMLTEAFIERIRDRTPELLAKRNIWTDARRDFSNA